MSLLKIRLKVLIVFSTCRLPHEYSPHENFCGHSKILYPPWLNWRIDLDNKIVSMLFNNTFNWQGTQSANPHNDYCQHFVDTGQRPQNFIRDVGECSGKGACLLKLTYKHLRSLSNQKKEARISIYILSRSTCCQSRPQSNLFPNDTLRN